MKLANNPDEEKWLTAEEAARNLVPCMRHHIMVFQGQSLVMLSPLPRWDGRRIFALSDIQKELLNDRAKK